MAIRVPGSGRWERQSGGGAAAGEARDYARAGEGVHGRRLILSNTLL